MIVHQQSQLTVNSGHIIQEKNTNIPENVVIVLLYTVLRESLN